MALNITLTYHPVDPKVEDLYRELGNVSVFNEVSVLEDFPDTEILVTNFLYRIDKSILDYLKKLKVIASPTTGLDHINLEECERRGITVISLKGETEFLRTIPSVAELTIWMMLELLRRPHHGRFMGNELKGKTVGFIGFGRIGKQVSERLVGFEVFGRIFDISDPLFSTTPHTLKFIEKWKHEKTFMSMFSEPDIVSLHVPLDASTEGMITEEHLKMMKPSALLVNTARSQIIAPGAIVRAIKEKWIAGYGTDVTRDEQELQELEELQKEGFNVVVTRHIFGNTVEARVATDLFIAKKVQEYVEPNRT